MYSNQNYSFPNYPRQSKSFYPSYYTQYPMNAPFPNQMMNQANNYTSYPKNRMSQRPLSRAFANFNYFNFLEGTQKTLNTVNQIIPIINQVSPMLRNAATVFKVANVLNTMPATETMQANTPTATAPSSINTANSIENPTLF